MLKKIMFGLVLVFFAVSANAQTNTFTPTPTLGINQVWYPTADFTPTTSYTPTPTFTGTVGTWQTAVGTYTATPSLTPTASYTPTNFIRIMSVGEYVAHGMHVLTLATPEYKYTGTFTYTPTPSFTGVWTVNKTYTATPSYTPTPTWTAINWNPASVGGFHAWWGRLGLYSGPNRRDAQLESIVPIQIGGTYTPVLTPTTSYTPTPTFTGTVGTWQTAVGTYTATPSLTPTVVYTVTKTWTPWIINGKNVEPLLPNQWVIAAGQRQYSPQPHVGTKWYQGQGFFNNPDVTYNDPLWNGKKSFIQFNIGLPTLTYTITPTPTSTPTNTTTATPTGTITNTPTPTGSFTYTTTPTSTATNTVTITPTPTNTPTPNN